jgi:hypothetical protein
MCVNFLCSTMKIPKACLHTKHDWIPCFSFPLVYPLFPSAIYFHPLQLPGVTDYKNIHKDVTRLWLVDFRAVNPKHAAVQFSVITVQFSVITVQFFVILYKNSTWFHMCEISHVKLCFTCSKFTCETSHVKFHMWSFTCETHNFTGVHMWKITCSKFTCSN